MGFLLKFQEIYGMYTHIRQGGLIKGRGVSTWYTGMESDNIVNKSILRLHDLS